MKTKPSRQVQRARRRAGLSTPQHQRGAAAIFGGFTILLSVIALFFAVNVGMLYYAQRDLQRLATVAAMAGADFGSGCLNGGVPGKLTDVTAQVVQSLQINSKLSDTQAKALLATGVNGQPPGVQLGKIDNSTGLHTFVPLTTPGDPQIDSAQVNLTSVAPSLLGGTFFPGASGTLKASATAQQPALGSFSIDTGLLTLNTNNSALLGPLLQGLLGTKSQIDIALVNSSGILNSKVSLANLELAAGVTNLHDLLNLSTNLTGALNILGNALSGTAGGLVSGLAGQAYNGDGGPVRNYFGDLFNNAGGQLNPLVTDAVSLVPFVNGADLLTALGQDAGQNQSISIQTNNGLLSLLNGLPGVSLKLFLKVIQPPQFSPPFPAGPLNTAHSAQITLNVRLNVDLYLLILKLATLNLGADLDVPSASGTLTSLKCPVSGTPNPVATVKATTAVATLTLGSFDPSQTFPALGSGNLIDVVPALSVLTVSLGTNKVSATVGSGAVVPTGPYDTYTSTQTDPLHPHIITYTAVAPDNTYTIGSSGLLSGTVSSLLSSLTSTNNLHVHVLGLDLTGLADGLLGAVSALLTPLLSVIDLLLDSLLQLLGIQVGTATVQMQGAVIGRPVIVSTALP